MSNREWVLAVLCLSFCLTGPGPALSAETPESNTVFFIMKTDKSMEQALADLKQAITDNNYVFIRQQNIDDMLVDLGHENRRVVLVYFCNFHMMDEALRIDPKVGVFLPCRITLIEKPDGIEMVAANPKLISQQLNNHELTPICDRLDTDYRRILEEASL